MRAMGAQRFDDLKAHREHRVERGHRLLEDHADVAAANAAQRALAERRSALGPET